MIEIKKDLSLPDSLREDLKKPFGKVMECSEIAKILKGSKKRVTAIGDSVSETLIRNGVSPSLIVWDGKTRRAAISDTSLLQGYAKPLKVKNPSGKITKEAWAAVSKSLSSKKASVFVDGEEDLLAIPAIINSADGDAVVYGLPGDGAILIVVDRKIKAVFQGFLNRFE